MKENGGQEKEDFPLAIVVVYSMKSIPQQFAC